MCLVEFAELNTELGEASDLTQGVGGTVPYLSFHRFVMNVMFPGEPDHPVLHPVRVSSVVIPMLQVGNQGENVCRYRRRLMTRNS